MHGRSGISKNVTNIKIFFIDCVLSFGAALIFCILFVFSTMGFSSAHSISFILFKISTTYFPTAMVLRNISSHKVYLLVFRPSQACFIPEFAIKLLFIYTKTLLVSFHILNN